MEGEGEGDRTAVKISNCSILIIAALPCYAIVSRPLAAVLAIVKTDHPAWYHRRIKIIFICRRAHTLSS